MSISRDHGARGGPWCRGWGQEPHEGVCRSQEARPVAKGPFLDLGLGSVMVQKPLCHQPLRQLWTKVTVPIQALSHLSNGDNAPRAPPRVRRKVDMTARTGPQDTAIAR